MVYAHVSQDEVELEYGICEEWRLLAQGTQDA
jgi:hypothetical protein